MNVKDFDFGPDGRIKNPGKFEGEMLYIPLFWEDSLEGCCDQNNDGSWGMDVSVSDLEHFTTAARYESGERLLGVMATIAALATKSRVVFVERDDGFVQEVGSGSTVRLLSPEERNPDHDPMEAGLEDGYQGFQA